MSNKTRIAIIDDDQSILKSLLRMLSVAGFEVVAFSSAREFLAAVDTEGVSSAISDLRMPGMDGLELQQTLRPRLPHLSMVFITGHGDLPTGVSAMKAGAVDFLEKPVRSEVLLEAINRAIERSRSLLAAATEIEELKIRYQRLTPREGEVFALVAAGLHNKQIGAELSAAEKTIKQHRGRVMNKMEAGSFAELVLMAERLRIRPAPRQPISPKPGANSPHKRDKPRSLEFFLARQQYSIRPRSDFRSRSCMPLSTLRKMSEIKKNVRADRMSQVESIT
jgi:FixJ family two-component response regulator